MNLTHSPFGANLMNSPTPESSESKGNVLLVDDIPENLQLLGDLLVKLGYTVRSVTSGKMALKTMRVKQPDIILLDIKMPEMDGYQVCQALKADQDLKDIPVIFISALDDVFDKVKAFNAGGIDYITKPFQVEEVVARIEGPLTIQRQQKQLQEEINKRQEAEEVLYQSRSLLASVLNCSLDGIAAMQAVREPVTGDIGDFRCLVVNPVIARILNRDRNELVGKMGFRRFLNHFDPHLFSKLITVVETGEALSEDISVNGESLAWYHLSAVKLGDGFSVTLRDITHRKQTEVALQDANERLEQLANLDGLTQVANRRCFDQRLQLEWHRSQRERQPLAAIMLDIDSFKAYNDYYGHLAGDECLIGITQALVRVIKRPTDLLARFGGEEFIILLPNTNEAGAIQLSQNIQSLVDSLAIPHDRTAVQNKTTLTVSLGITSFIPTPDYLPETLVALADQALYQAKAQGRNCYVVAYPPA